MNKLPLSPRANRARTVLIAAYLCAYIIALLFAIYGGNWPSDDQRCSTNSGGYCQ